MDTLELNIKLKPCKPWSEILIAELAELGFDSFVETDEGIQAYAPAELNYQEVLKQSSLYSNDELEFELSHEIIPQQNWNAKWEEEFDPVHVENYATILAPFHDAVNVVGLPVIIQPQMSFGTGHHQTTWLMTKMLFEMDLPEKVLDMGSGTGVLAIIAEKLGAKEILAIDIEEWAAINAKENVELNKCELIEVVEGDVDKIGDRRFGLIIANINKNILKSHLQAYNRALELNGTLLLSGFFESDVDEMTDFAKDCGFRKDKVLTKDEWAAMSLTKTNE